VNEKLNPTTRDVSRAPTAGLLMETCSLERGPLPRGAFWSMSTAAASSAVSSVLSGTPAVVSLVMGRRYWV
jgi:hypothetical protein